MPLLVLLPLILSAVILAALWAAHVSAWRERIRAFGLGSAELVPFPGRVRKPFSIIRVADAFEPDTSIIWETQIPALARIYASGRRGLPIEILRPLFMHSAARYPELYEGTEFESWLQFLENANLISLTHDVAAITPAGVEFLKCRVAANAVV